MKIADLFVKLGLKDRDFKRGIDGAEKRTNKFSAAMKRVGGMIAGVFAVGQIARFTAELVKLGGTAEGVREAFNRIADDRILRDLQDATAGTVSQLELMQRAVSASNLGLPVQNLASLFEFATKRAQETGESVDYLVNSIVTGIGRKSPLILDNLGISAIALREKLDGVGLGTASVAEVAAAVGEIAADSMRESGEVIDSNAIKLQNLNAQWDDFKMNLAESEGFAKTMSGSLTELQQVATIAFAENLSGWRKFTAILFGSTDKWEKLSKQVEEFNKRQLDVAEVNEEYERMYERAKNPFGGSGDGGEQKIKTVSERIAELSEEISIQQSLITKDAPYTSVIEAIDKVKELEAELKKLNDAFPQTIQRAASLPAMTGQAGTPQIAGEAPMPGGLADMSGFLERNNAYTKRLLDENLGDWNNFSNQLAMVAEGGIADSIATVAESLSQLASGQINLQGFFSNVISQLANFLKTIGKMFILYGIAELEFFKSFAEGPAGAIKLIAAGAALVAIGGAIGSLASSASNGITGTSTGSVQFNIKTVDRQDNELIAKVSGKDLAFVLQRRGTFTSNA